MAPVGVLQEKQLCPGHRGRPSCRSFSGCWTETCPWPWPPAHPLSPPTLLTCRAWQPEVGVSPVGHTEACSAGVSGVSVGLSGACAIAWVVGGGLQPQKGAPGRGQKDQQPRSSPENSTVTSPPRTDPLFPQTPIVILPILPLTLPGPSLSAGAQVRQVPMRQLTGGVLHSKFWVVDGRHIYVGSANMDWRALTQVSAPTMRFPVDGQHRP